MNCSTVATATPPRVPSFRGVRQSRGVCIRKQIPKVLIRGILIPAGSASGIHTPPLSWHPFQKGTLPPCRLHPHSPFHSCLSCLSMFHNRLTKQVNIRVFRVFRCSITVSQNKSIFVSFVFFDVQ